MTVNEFYKSIFGSKTYKISLDGGCTCPNRDGTLAVGGCSFCNGNGSGEFAMFGTNVQKQVENAKKLVSKKIKNVGESQAKYIAYFQSFTNTYGKLEVLKENWNNALRCQDVVGLAIGTRPDCLSKECVQELGKIANNHFVQIELGLQTTNESTAKKMNRCYENQSYFDAVSNLHKQNPKIHVVTHIIFGLPGDSKDDMLKTVKDAVSAGTDGIKITSLYITKGSELEKQYLNGEISVLEKQEYFELLSKAVKLIPTNVVIHRLTGDPSKKELIAPNWTTDKKRVMNELKKYVTI